MTKPRGEKGGLRGCRVNIGKLGTTALSARSGRSDIAQRPNIGSIGGVISARRSIANGTDSTSYRGEHTSASWRPDFESHEGRRCSGALPVRTPIGLLLCAPLVPRGGRPCARWGWGAPLCTGPRLRRDDSHFYLLGPPKANKVPPQPIQLAFGVIRGHRELSAAGRTLQRKK